MSSLGPWGDADRQTVAIGVGETYAAEHRPELKMEIQAEMFKKQVLSRAEFVRVTGPNSSSFGPALKILRDSIPLNEQLPIKRLTALLRRDDYHLYIFKIKEEIAGIILIYLPTKHPFALLDYMAVRIDLRSKGIGTLLFHKAVNIVRNKRPQANWLILEVDDNRQGDEERRRINGRRIEFYRRMKVRLLTNVPYLFPSSTGIGVPMRLMEFPLREGVELTIADLRSSIQDIFVQVHGLDQESDLLRKNLNSLPQTILFE